MTTLNWNELKWGEHLRFGAGGPRGEIDTGLTYTVVDLSPGPRRAATLRGDSAAHGEPVFVRVTPRLLVTHQVTRVQPWGVLAEHFSQTFRLNAVRGPAWLPRVLEVSHAPAVTPDFVPVGVIGPQGEVAFKLRGQLLTHWTLRLTAARCDWPLSVEYDGGITTASVDVDGPFGVRTVLAFGFTANAGDHDTLIVGRSLRLACELAAQGAGG